MPPKSKLVEMFTEPAHIDDTSIVPNDGPKIPVMGDPEWSDWVLSHLLETEKDYNNGYPKSAALKRLVIKFVGEIVGSESHVIAVPSADNNFTAVCEHLVSLVPYNSSVALKQIRGVGESNVDNSDAPFSKYPLAIASSRAAGRAYRDALGVNTVAAEELSRVAEERDDINDPASSAQQAAIKALCKKNGIDFMKFINMGSSRYEDVGEVNSGTAKKMLTKLNEYQREQSSIPERIIL